MGVSTDAYLMFGFAVEEGSDDHDKCEALQEDYDRVQRLEKKHGVTVQHHCSDKYTQYVVGDERTQKRAHRGYPQAINPMIVAYAGQAEIVRIRAFCEEVGIKFQDPTWLLFSYWG